MYDRVQTLKNPFLQG